MSLANRVVLVGIMITAIGSLVNAGDIDKEGEIDSVSTILTSSDVLAINQGTMQVNYNGKGVSEGSGDHALDAAGGLNCVGALTAMNGAFENESGICVMTFADGSKTMTRYSGGGMLGRSAEGTWEYIGGAGMFEGISGGGSWARSYVPAPSEGVIASKTKLTGNFKLP